MSLYTLGIISIVSIFLSFQLLTGSMERFQQVLATFILINAFLAFLVLTISRNIIQESFDISSLRAWLILCMATTFLFIVTRLISIGPSPVLAMVSEILFAFTIILNSVTVFFILNSVIDVRLNQWSTRYQERQLGNYLERRVRTKGRSSFLVEFDSITRKLVGPAAQTRPCPHCLSAINFNEKIEWLGPTALACSQCGKIVNIDDLLIGL
ncbi:MAG: hypothetical protein BV458_11515 [Thermoplasmata archaeon M9B2D]|nr:MAG: hypothetical protein BV458_11515 [Thermoplasmata archaeon M9B2D]